MWLPEGAVDRDTLETLPRSGIQFTILSPYAAKRVQAQILRKIGRGNWQDVSGGRIDPSRAYLRNLPSGRSIAVFFYDGPISRAVAFEDILYRGEDFAQRLIGALLRRRAIGLSWSTSPPTANPTATITAHGDMALGYALHHIEAKRLAKLTVYGEFLEKHPPTHEVEIFENSAWSCAHGVERWRSNCGCNSGGHAGWNQEWRAPLRDAFDWLRDYVAPALRTAGRRAASRIPGRRATTTSTSFSTARPKRSDKFFEKHAAAS